MWTTFEPIITQLLHNLFNLKAELQVLFYLTTFILKLGVVQV